MEDLRHGCR